MNPANLSSPNLIAATSPARAPRSGRLRGVGAVAAGLVFIVAVTTAIDLILRAAGVFPALGEPPMSHELFALAFAYRFVIDVAGSALTARLSPTNPMRYALFLGGIGLLLSIAGAVAMWDPSRAWYPIAVAVSALPCAWLGGRFVEYRLSDRQMAAELSAAHEVG